MICMLVLICKTDDERKIIYEDFIIGDIGQSLTCITEKVYC